MGIYVIKATANNRTKKNGKVALYIFGISSSNLYAARNKFIPTGGVKNPNSRFAIKMIAKWTGSIPKCTPKGAISGTITIIAENMSIKHPTIKRKILSINKNVYFDAIAPFAHDKIKIGI